MRVRTDAQTGSNYRSRLYEHYATDQSGLRLGAEFERVLSAQVLVHLPIAGRVLDIGAGQGGLVELLGRRGYEAIGVDSSPEQAAIAQQNGIDIRHADLREFLADHRSEFDAITAIDLLEHFDKPDVIQVLDLIYAALKPGGVIVARSPNGTSPFSGRMYHGDFTHGVLYTDRSVAQLAATAGFESVVVLNAPPVAHGPLSLARLLVWRVYSGLFKLALAAETGDPPRKHVVTLNLIFVARKPRVA